MLLKVYYIFSNYLFNFVEIINNNGKLNQTWRRYQYLITLYSASSQLLLGDINGAMSGLLNYTQKVNKDQNMMDNSNDLQSQSISSFLDSGFDYDFGAELFPDMENKEDISSLRNAKGSGAPPPAILFKAILHTNLGLVYVLKVLYFISILRQLI